MVLLDCSSAGRLFLALIKSWASWSSAIYFYLCYFAEFLPVGSLWIAVFTVSQNKGFFFLFVCFNHILKYVCGHFHRNWGRKGVVKRAGSNRHLGTEVSTSFSKTITNTIYSPVYGMRVKSP